MKRAISKSLAILLSFLFIFQTSLVAFADDEPDWQDANWTQEEFNDILAQNPNNQISTYTSGLIYSYAIGVSSSGSNLLIAGKTTCDPDVVKCGFKVVTIKRRKSSTASWVTYKTYEDLYIDNSGYTLTKTLSVPTGYQYRVYCTHYAKKNILSTEKIENVSNVVAIG
ncbi:MAG: hypothetical protein ACI4XC_05670 [Eubacterium sp.]